MHTTRIALILLAAGQSRRFGGNKLAAPLGGEALLRRTARIYAAVPFAERLVVTGPETPDIADMGYRAVALAPPGAPQSASIAQGMAALSAGPLDGVMIALGDMPLVSTAHVQALLAAFKGSIVASGWGEIASPPAIFPYDRFPALLALEGDRGARALLAGAERVLAAANELLDVDRPDDLDCLPPA